MQLTINDQTYTVADGDPDRPLLWVLRDELGLIGTKFGCGEGLCGSCTVHVNGQARRACLTPVGKMANAKIRTVEGLLQADGRLHPVQQAFIDAQAPQCGWCMNGQMMTAAALLERNANPTEEQVIAAMDGNYCRCGTYARIKAAVLKAAELLREGAQ